MTTQFTFKTQPSSALGQGVYSVTDGAKLLRVSPSKLRYWFVGGKDRKPFFEPEYKVDNAPLLLSFHDLIDAFFAVQLRSHGLSLQQLRRVYEGLKKYFGEKHAFCREDLRTDGETIFLHVVDDRGRQELVEVLSRQRCFPQVLLPFLKQLDFDVKRMASRWNIARGVVVDPAISYGQPVVLGSCISAEILARQWRANGRNMDRVAAFWDIPQSQVESAVRFIEGMAA